MNSLGLVYYGDGPVRLPQRCSWFVCEEAATGSPESSVGGHGHPRARHWDELCVEKGAVVREDHVPGVR